MEIGGRMLNQKKLNVMKNKNYDFNKYYHFSDEVSDLLFQKVKWTENGITHLGTVTEIFSVKGIKYLTVMTIFGKRLKVKMSKVRLYSEQMRA
jgi:hypothetical protein